MAHAKKNMRRLRHSLKNGTNLNLRFGIMNCNGPKWERSGKWTLDVQPVMNDDLRSTSTDIPEHLKPSFLKEDNFTDALPDVVPVSSATSPQRDAKGRKSSKVVNLYRQLRASSRHHNVTGYSHFVTSDSTPESRQRDQAKRYRGKPFVKAARSS